MLRNMKSAVDVNKSRDGDDLGPYPADVDNNPTRQRVLERALRNVTISTAILGFVCVALVMLLITVFPLKQVYPYLVTFKGNENQVVAIEPISTNAPGIQYATEANVRDYVVQRHSFVPINTRMDAQWGAESRLATMTDGEEYKEFTQAAELERTRMMSAGYTRQIEIESATMIRPDTWQVAFQTFDSLGGNAGTLTADPATVLSSRDSRTSLLEADLTPRTNTKRWLATMTVEYRPQQISYDKRLLNPLGFTITDYSVTGRN